MTGISLRSAPALKSLKADSAAGVALPQRVKVLGWGVNETTEGSIIVDELTAKVFSANQKLIGRERVALDFEHNTVPGSVEYNRTNEPRAIAGNCNLVCIPGEGIFGEALTYTATGKTSAPDYEDLSLAPYLDETGRVIAAHSVALTRTGAAHGINFKSADLAELSATNNQLGADLKILSAGTTPAASTKNKPMADKFISLVTLTAALGIPDTSSDEIILSKLKERLTPPGAVDLTPLTTRITDLETKLKASSDAATLGERTRLVSLFATEGKAPVNPATGKAYTADEMKALDLPILQLLHANTPVTVPLASRGTRTGIESAGSETPEGFAQLVTLHATKLPANTAAPKAKALELAIKESPKGYAAWRAADGKPGL